MIISASIVVLTHSSTTSRGAPTGVAKTHPGTTQASTFCLPCNTLDVHLLTQRVVVVHTFQLRCSLQLDYDTYSSPAHRLLQFCSPTAQQNN